MSATRPRRIVRRAVIALAVVVLLPVWYVASWGTVQWLPGRGVSLQPERQISQAISSGGVDRIVFMPLDRYSLCGLPGGKSAWVFSRWCFWRGRVEVREVTWHELEEWYEF